MVKKYKQNKFKNVLLNRKLKKTRDIINKFIINKFIYKIYDLYYKCYLINILLN